MDAFRQGKPEVLTYDPDPKRVAQRRYQALKYHPSMGYLGLQRDEYPYASTEEGGAGAAVAYVPAAENSTQGNQLKALYSGLDPGDHFLVLPVPKDTEPDVPVVNNNRRNNIGNATKIGMGAVIAIGAYETVKWGVAAFLAPETLGGSLGVAAATP